MRPGFTTATQRSGLPLPEPMRVSAGFSVTGLSEKTVIHTLPPRRVLRVMAIRAASIWRAVIHPGSRAWMPYSPKVTSVPPLLWPFVRPRCCLRCLTFLGINMGSRSQCGDRSGSSVRPERLAARRASSACESKSSVTVPGMELGRLVRSERATLDLLLLGEEALQLGIGLLDEGLGLDRG